MYQGRMMKRIRATENRVNRMIETKEGQYKTASNVGFYQNQVAVLQCPALGGDLNPFYLVPGTQDPMAQNTGQRIGDQVTVKGLKIVGFFENALQRPKVFYRLMLIKCSKGDSINRNTLFKNDSDNKMIDVINTERFNVIAQKVFTVSVSNAGNSAVNSAGVPVNNASVAGVPSRIVRMWIPGYKFGRGGNIQFESGVNGQLKFFDYRLVLLVYDWYGTPQDINIVGQINELYTKVYYKDA